MLSLVPRDDIRSFFSVVIFLFFPLLDVHPIISRPPNRSMSGCCHHALGLSVYMALFSCGEEALKSAGWSDEEIEKLPVSKALLYETYSRYHAKDRTHVLKVDGGSLVLKYSGEEDPCGLLRREQFVPDDDTKDVAN